MTAFLSRFWQRIYQRLYQRLLLDLGLRDGPQRYYSLDADLLPSLKDLAARERRSEEEILSELVTQGLQQRQKIDERYQRWNQLSRREPEVVALSCLGYTNPEIANHLILSPETVRTYARSAMRKLGVRTKAQLRQVLEEWDFSAWERSSGRRRHI